MRNTFILTAVSALALSLAACDQPQAPAPEAPPAEPTAPAPGPVADVLNAEGYGPLRVGMTLAQVEAAMGADSDPNAVGGPDPASCDIFHPARAPEGLNVMIQNGVLTSVWVSRNTDVVTDRGLKVGATAAEVKTTYGAALKVDPHKYQEAPAEYLFAWATPAQDGPTARGLKYEVGMDGKVQTIAAGGESIGYVEGCL